MPTGYTYVVAEGEVTTLREFALKCARGMGALISMRDEPANATIPASIEPDVEHYDEQIAYYTEALDKLNNSTPEQLQARFETENKEIRDRRQNTIRNNALIKERYEAMIAKVVAWQGAPEGLKEFMLQQLIDSLKFDVPETDNDYVEEEHESIDRWLANEREYLETSIERSKKYRQEEIDRCVERNKWLQKLYTSLEGVE